MQCRGTKRWRLARGPVPDPLTNFHPASSNRAALAADARTHRACTERALVPPADDDGEGEAARLGDTDGEAVADGDGVRESEALTLDDAD